MPKQGRMIQRSLNNESDPSRRDLAGRCGDDGGGKRGQEGDILVVHLLDVSRLVTDHPELSHCLSIFRSFSLSVT